MISINNPPRPRPPYTSDKESKKKTHEFSRCSFATIKIVRSCAVGATPGNERLVTDSFAPDSRAWRLQYARAEALTALGTIVETDAADALNARGLADDESHNDWGDSRHDDRGASMEVVSLFTCITPLHL
jgi:hypothetical protein